MLGEKKNPPAWWAGGNIKENNKNYLCGIWADLGFFSTLKLILFRYSHVRRLFSVWIPSISPTTGDRRYDAGD